MANEAFAKKLIIPTQESAPKTAFRLADNLYLGFERVGRSTADRVFATEEDLLRQLDDKQMVEVELLFLPYYVPLGHSVLRIGKSLYELSRKQGWVCHNQGLDNARGFIFSNPYFRSMLKQYNCIPPFSIGLRYSLKREDVQKLRSRLEVLATKECNEGFSIFFNNCNQALIALLRSYGINTQLTFMQRFSSVLTFKKLLLDFAKEGKTVSVYPIAGFDQDYKEEISDLFPMQLTPAQTTTQELLRCMRYITLNPREIFLKILRIR